MPRASISKFSLREFTQELALLYAATFNPDAAARDRALARVDAINWAMQAAGYSAESIASMNADAQRKVGYVPATPPAATSTAPATPDAAPAKPK